MRSLHPGVFERLERHVTGPNPISSHRAEPHNAEAALHGEHWEKQKAKERDLEEPCPTVGHECHSRSCGRVAPISMFRCLGTRVYEEVP